MIMGAWGLGRKPKLPYDAEVEYLKSTGTQWIDTGVSCTSNSGFGIDGIFLTYTTDQSFPVMAGAQSSDWSVWLSVYEADASVYIGNEIDSIVMGYHDRITARLNYLNNGRVTTENPVQSMGCQVSATGEHYGIFAAISAGDAVCCCKAKVFSMNVSVGTDVVRQFQPVRFTNEQGVSEGAMYDRVSGQLFCNAGTGSFAIGPDK